MWLKVAMAGYLGWYGAPTYVWPFIFSGAAFYLALLIWHVAFLILYYWLTEKIRKAWLPASLLIPSTWLLGYAVLVVSFGWTGMLTFVRTWMWP
jgi:hypothetical protein